MPGYDGTGPRGRGPMTGKGDGYCIMEVPDTPDQPVTGFIGLSGKPVTLAPRPVSSCVAPSSAQITGIKNLLAVIERDLRDLELVSRCLGDPDRTAASDDTATFPDMNAP